MKLAVLVDIAEHRLEEFMVFRLLAEEKPTLLQRDAMRNIGRTQHVAIRHTGLDVLTQSLIRHLRGGADDIHLDARVLRGERPPDAFRGLRRIVRAVPGELAFAPGRLVEHFVIVVCLSECAPRQWSGGSEGRGNEGSAAHSHGNPPRRSRLLPSYSLLLDLCGYVRRFIAAIFRATAGAVVAGTDRLPSVGILRLRTSAAGRRTGARGITAD